MVESTTYSYEQPSLDYQVVSFRLSKFQRTRVWWRGEGVLVYMGIASQQVVSKLNIGKSEHHGSQDDRGACERLQMIARFCCDWRVGLRIWENIFPIITYGLLVI
jgi:hypothetical protein